MSSGDCLLVPAMLQYAGNDADNADEEDDVDFTRHVCDNTVATVRMGLNICS